MAANTSRANATTTSATDQPLTPYRGPTGAAGGGHDIPVVGVVGLALEALVGQRTVTHRT